MTSHSHKYTHRSQLKFGANIFSDCSETKYLFERERNDKRISCIFQIGNRGKQLANLQEKTIWAKIRQKATIAEV